MPLENPREFARRVRYRPSVVEILEGRQLLATLTVTTTADSGTGSLRDAITTADLSTNPTTIKFDIPGTGVQDIDLVTPLPDVASPITIDGTSQPGYAGTPLIEIFGGPRILDTAPTVGTTLPYSLRIAGNGASVEGIAFNDDYGTAVLVEGSDNLIAGDTFGMTTGNPVPGFPQGIGTGVEIEPGSSGAASQNTIGGTTAATHNSFSIGYAAYQPEGTPDLYLDGVLLQVPSGAAVDNLIEGNTIISPTGPGPEGAFFSAIIDSGIMTMGDTGTTIGGTVSGAANVLEHMNDGVQEQDGSKGSLIEGNALIANQMGLELRGSSSTIGGTTPGARNVISGNTMDGIFLAGNANLIEGNSIGTDYMGTVALGNQTNGIVDQGSANTIGGSVAGAGNLISGNSLAGLELEEYVATGLTGALVQGNLIGTDATGTRAIPNGTGIQAGGASTIGGTIPAERNIISGNTNDGITGGTVLIEGNYIGTDITGTNALGNGGNGITIEGIAQVGGTVPGSGNLISANQNGIVIPNSPDQALIQGNLIGTNAAGTAALGNSGLGLSVYGTSSTIGGTTPGAANVISGNGTDGVFLQNSSVGNLVEGNLIGTDVTGTAPLGNALYGVVVSGTNNTLGGTGAAANQILYNGTPIYSGGVGNVIAGNVGAASADLLVSSSVPQAGPAVVGMPVPYSFYVTNQGPETATGIELAIVDLFPQNASLVGIYPSQGTITVVNPTAAFVNIGTLAPGSVVSVAVIVVPRVAGGNSTVYTFAGGSQFDPNPANNAALANIPVVAAPSLSAADVPLLADSAPVDPRKRK
jgi:hypothetical protein